MAKAALFSHLTRRPLDSSRHTNIPFTAHLSNLRYASLDLGFFSFRVKLRRNKHCYNPLVPTHAYDKFASASITICLANIVYFCRLSNAL